jgi:hypothetical protein
MYINYEDQGFNHNKNYNELSIYINTNKKTIKTMTVQYHSPTTINKIITSTFRLS